MKSVERPRQAVILAGGRGTRLQPLTFHRPKPMIRFHGRPFLEYLIEQLRSEGFESIVLLLGYLPEVIRRHFGDGSAYGVKIRYTVTDPDALTATRMKSALDAGLLEERFLLLYCDNYWPLRMEQMWDAYGAAGLPPAMVTVYRNHDGYSRSNVRVDEDSWVTVFDRSRTAPGLQGVEIGYAIIDRQVLDLLPEQDVLFEEAVYPRLAERRQLLANVTQHRYYSVGAIERLGRTGEFLARRPTIILDRDGVLNRKPPRAEYVRNCSEFVWLPGALEALGLLGSAGYRIVVVSNQAGIARGAMTTVDVDAIHERMLREAAEAGGPIEAVLYCPHHWDDNCECRKPKPGMLFEVQRRFHCDLTRTVFAGDDERDGLAAEAAGCPFIAIDTDYPLLEAVRQLLPRQTRSDNERETTAASAAGAMTL
jgi:histidinol-phosphate phosphatase family protein